MEITKLLYLLVLTSTSLGVNIKKCYPRKWLCTQNSYTFCDEDTKLSGIRSIWVKDGQEEWIVEGRMLTFNGSINEEGSWQCALIFTNGSNTTWSHAEIYYADVTSRNSTIIANSSSETIEVRCNFSIGDQTRQRKMQFVALGYPCGESNVHYRNIRNFSEGYPSFLEGHPSWNDFSAIVNISCLQAYPKYRDPFVIACSMKLNDDSPTVISYIHVLQDCSEEVESRKSYHINFIHKDCNASDAEAVKSSLLQKNACLKTNFTVMINCSEGILTINSKRTIPLSSLERALQNIANISQIDNNTTSVSTTTSITTTPITAETKSFIIIISFIFSSILLLFLALLFLFCTYMQISNNRKYSTLNPSFPGSLECSNLQHSLSSQHRNILLFELSYGINSMSSSQLPLVGISEEAAITPLRLNAGVNAGHENVSYQLFHVAANEENRNAVPEIESH